MGYRHRAIRKDQLAARGCIDAQLLFFFSDFESWRAFFHHQRCDSFFALGGVRIHISDSRVGRSAAGDPSLGAIDDIRIALLHRLRLQRRGVRAGLRLGQRVATDFFTSREWMQKFLLLFFGAEAMNRIAKSRGIEPAALIREWVLEKLHSC